MRKNIVPEQKTSFEINLKHMVIQIKYRYIL